MAANKTATATNNNFFGTHGAEMFNPIPVVSPLKFRGAGRAECIVASRPNAWSLSLDSERDPAHFIGVNPCEQKPLPICLSSESSSEDFFYFRSAIEANGDFTSAARRRGFEVAAGSSFLF